MNRLVLGHGLVVSVIVVLLVLRFGGGPGEGAREDEYPKRPVRVVVPFAAGGGSDRFVRLIQKAVAEEDLLGQPLVVINQGGGSGTIGSRTVKNARPDGYKILCLHDAIMTSQLSGTVEYGPEAFEPIAQTGGIVMMVLVKADSPYRGLQDLLAEAKRSPETVKLGTNIGSPAHFAGRKLEQAYSGASFNYVQSGGGQKRYALLIGGHIDVGVFSLEEYTAYRGDGKIRALAIMTPERHPAIPEVRTALEQGIEAVASNAQYWWAPKGTPPERIDHLAKVLKAAMESALVRAELERLAIDPVYRRGAELKRSLEERSAELGELRFSNARELPDFPLYAMVVTAGFGLLVVASCLRGDSPPGAREAALRNVLPDDPHTRKRPLLALACFGLLIAYVLILQAGMVPYAFATAGLILFSGGAMARWNLRRLVVIGEIALITGLGTELVFTRIFSVALP